MLSNYDRIDAESATNSAHVAAAQHLAVLLEGLSADRGKHAYLSQHRCEVHIDLLAEEAILVELENCRRRNLYSATGGWDARPFTFMGTRD